MHKRINQPPESVAGVVFSPDRSAILLILRRDVPVWVLPGGGIDAGESPEAASIREILEETGLSVKVDRLIGHYTPVNRLTKRTNLYECSAVSGNIRGSEETRDARFFALDNLPAMPPPYPEWIQDGLAPGAPIERELRSVNYRTLFKYTLSHPLLVARFLLARAGLSINSSSQNH
jgi:8-oxo-dGTP pyrophosphatase MutT (NUDIX family)